MAPSASRYAAYKHDTHLLVYWVTSTYNFIISTKPEKHCPSLRMKSKPRTTLRGLKRMVEVISKNTTGSNTPDFIFHLFRSVIEARTEAWRAFTMANSKNPDKKVEESNESHKPFLDALQEAFDKLGGQQWASSQNGLRRETAQDMEGKVRKAVKANKFSSLQTDDDQTESKDGNSTSAPKPPTKQTRRNHRILKKTKRKQKHKSSGSKLEDTPLNSYRIIDKKGGLRPEYQMATFLLFQELHDLRGLLVDVWTRAAESKLNVAIAGAISNIAIATLKRSELAFSEDFPDGDLYEGLVKNLLLDVDQSETEEPMIVSVPRHVFLTDGGSGQVDVEADMNDVLLVYAYQDFIDFVEDFQNNNNGKSSKTFAAVLKKWDPKFDLTNASREERRQWRRTYTIKWLYDLVNFFSSLCEEDGTNDGVERARKADWSYLRGQDPSRHMHLFGLDEFARFACFMAWKIKGKERSDYIKLHHMLQLQIIIDSMSVSQGWSDKSITNEIHILDENVQDSRPRRDLDRFPDRDRVNPIFRYLDSSKDLISRLKDCEKYYGDSGYSTHAEIIEKQTHRIRELLGEPEHKPGQTKPQEPRFSNRDRKRFWQHSPLLCGLGLMETLEISFGLGTLLWNQIPEPVLIVHLYNMLVKRGFIREPVGLYATLPENFKGAFFPGSTAPNSVRAVAEAFSKRIRRISANGIKGLQRKNGAKPGGILDDLDKGRLQDVFYPTMDIPAEKIAAPTFLALLRLCAVKQVVDVNTKEPLRFVPTDLVERWLMPRRGGEYRSSEGDLLRLVNKQRDHWRRRKETVSLDALLDHQPDTTKQSAHDQVAEAEDPLKINAGDELRTVKRDLEIEFNRDRPFFTLNYASMTAEFFRLFERIEERLKALNYPAYVEVFEFGSKSTPKESPRMSLARNVMSRLEYMPLNETDDQCAKAIAEEFQACSGEYNDFWYFGADGN